MPRRLASLTGRVRRRIARSNQQDRLDLPDVADPAARSVSFEELAEAYAEAARGLLLGGADLLMVETVFDVLNAKAAIYAIQGVFEELGVEVPLWISGTITDASGRTLSGHTVEASGTPSATPGR